MIKVLVAEDMQVVRHGLVALLDGECGIEVVGRASDAKAAPDIAKHRTGRRALRRADAVNRYRSGTRGERTEISRP
ncbi:hypothetical protein [Streptomyces sp. NPDC002540]